jgi:Domain of unknown function (DUF4288)
MAWRWFAVKTIYRTRALGKPRFTDDDFDAEATLIEERVVLFRARGFDEALDKGEREARAYTRGEHRNRYGQRVVQKYLAACDAYELFDEPGNRAEVFSSTEVVPESVSDAEVADRRIGAERERSRARTKFLNREFGGRLL